MTGCAVDYDQGAHAGVFARQLGEVMARYAAEHHSRMVDVLVGLRDRRGRVFCLGVGGGAANAAHAACDLRKLCGIEAYAPTDGIAELTARTNDEGWSTVFSEWLRVSRLCAQDVLLVFSVGGGFPKVSQCVHLAVEAAMQAHAKIVGVVGRSTGAVAIYGDEVLVTGILGALLTPVTEAAQIAVLHALVSDPRLQIAPTTW